METRQPPGERFRNFVRAFMPEHRCKYRFNSLLNWKVGQMIKSGWVFKVFHADPDFSKNFGSILDTDLTPFMIYSLNKHRRWEISLNQRKLEVLQKLNQNLEIMVFQRVSIRAWIDNWHMFPPHYITALHHSKIRRSYQISEDGRYEETRFGGVGRFYGPSSTKKVTRTPTTIEIVTYNIVQEPRNWKKVFTKDFRKFKWDKEDPKIYRKLKIASKFIEDDLEYYYLDFEEELEDNIEIFENQHHPIGFYNFSNHFVFKKPRKTRKNQYFHEFELI